MISPGEWQVTDVKYTVESYFELPLMFVVICLLVWVARKHREAHLWFLVMGVVLLATRQGLHWLLLLDLAEAGLSERVSSIQPHLGTLGWLLILLYSIMSITRSRDGGGKG